MKRLFNTLIVLLFAAATAFGEDRIGLDGIWRFQLDPLAFGMTPGSELHLSKLAETIVLPGSTDEGGKGIKNNARYVDRLSRKFEYQGPAWYQREVVIPSDWQDKHIELFLERCHWHTTVYVDNAMVGSDERLSAPNRFDVSRQLKPGLHTITICVDNRLKYAMDNWNHGTTEYTQTNWNGIVGEISLRATNVVRVGRLNAYPDVKAGKVNVTAEVLGLRHGEKASVKMIVREKGGNQVAVAFAEADSALAAQGVSRSIDMGKRVKLWDEFSPNLYELEAIVDADGKQDEKTVTFGMRSVEQGKHHVRLNGHDIHLRGVLDCAVFPLTGYPSTSIDDWKKIFNTIKSYGMNHVRFHSWCPPEAAFAAADQVGIYVQAELPMWIKDVGSFPARRDFFEKEMYAVLNAYGNHPSFILMCNGNENEGNFDVLEDLVKKAQAYDSRRLYSASTARTHVAADQFYVSHVSSKGWVTVYEGKPSTDWDLTGTCDIDVPVIAHETGQRCMYPNFGEIQKYKGVLEARNMEVFRERLARNGMLHQADDFFKATGAHTVLQYKEVNEALMRTGNSAGFQLLGLADFPGQGSAFVGILDAFWESKNLVDPEKFREWCAPTVLLARIPKRTYLTSEQLTAKIHCYNYGPSSLRGERLTWQLLDSKRRVYASGKFKPTTVAMCAVDSLGALSVDLSGIREADKYTLRVQLGDVKNEWAIWVYPDGDCATDCPMAVSRQWNAQVKEMLAAGKDVLLVPDAPMGRKTKFASHFWNPIMFRWNPMIVGTLIDAQHHAFDNFPTEHFADWQWWDILNNARAVELDDFAALTPIIQSIDSYEHNHKLGIAFEARVGKGRLLVALIDIDKDIDQRPATRLLLHSFSKYMQSEWFNPATTVQFYELDKLFDNAIPKPVNTVPDAATLQLLNK